MKRSLDREEHIHRYVNVQALLKHVAPNRLRWSEAQTDPALPIQKFIEQVCRSQAHKWRKYAQSRNGGSDRAPRPNLP
jgi:hypothetical protein